MAFSEEMGKYADGSMTARGTNFAGQTECE
jgi:hypothetical protein